MKQAFDSLTFVSAKRLPLTLAAACLGIGAAGLAVTLYQPVDLSPFRPASQPPVLEQISSTLPAVTPEPFDFVLEGTIDAEPLTPETTPEAARAVAATRPFVPAVRTAVPIAAPEPSPEVGPGVSAAGSGKPAAIEDVADAFQPVPSKDNAGAPPEPYFLPDQGMGKDRAATAPIPVPAGVVAGTLPELSEHEPNPDIPAPQAPKDEARRDSGPGDKAPKDKAPRDETRKDEARK